jgi:hypothetical protein
MDTMRTRSLLLFSLFMFGFLVAVLVSTLRLGIGSVSHLELVGSAAIYE